MASFFMFWSVQQFVQNAHLMLLPTVKWMSTLLQELCLSLSPSQCLSAYLLGMFMKEHVLPVEVKVLLWLDMSITCLGACRAKFVLLDQGLTTQNVESFIGPKTINLDLQKN